MRRLIGWTAGVIGIAALARALARRQARHERATVAPPVDDRAEALRRKLDELLGHFRFGTARDVLQYGSVPSRPAVPPMPMTAPTGQSGVAA